jgi:hypothetical protein
MSEAAPAPEPKPSPSARLLALVRALIAFGRQVADNLRASHPTLGPGDIRLILNRIARGLMLAEAPEARIIRDAPGLDEPKPRRPRAPRATRCAVTPRPAETPNQRLAALAALPSAEQIAAKVRGRPIGAVIADICRDIGITPGSTLWHEIRDLMMEHGGNVTRLLLDLLDRPFFHHAALAWPSSPTQVADLPPYAPAWAFAGTGPPRVR